MVTLIIHFMVLGILRLGIEQVAGQAAPAYLQENPMVNHLYFSESGWKRLEQLECIANIQKLASQYPNWNVESYGYALKMCEEMTKEADPNTQVIPTTINNEDVLNERGTRRENHLLNPRGAFQFKHFFQSL